jgi:hypothetical protein
MRVVDGKLQLVCRQRDYMLRAISIFMISFDPP